MPEITFQNDDSMDRGLHASFYVGEPDKGGTFVAAVHGYQGPGQKGTVDLPANQTYWVTVICNNIGPDPAGTVLASQNGFKMPGNTMVIYKNKTLKFL